MRPEPVPPPPSPVDLTRAAGEVATTLANGLKNQPLVIGLLVINIGFLAAMFVAVREARSHDHHEMRLLLERCVPQQKG